MIASLFVKRLHNHLTDFHKMRCGSKKYHDCLASAVRHEVMVISSESGGGSSSSEEYEESIPCKRKIKQEQKQNCTSIYRKVYTTSEEDSDCQNYPEIFFKVKREATKEGHSWQKITFHQLHPTHVPIKEQLKISSTTITTILTSVMMMNV